jgi:MFS family permease
MGATLIGWTSLSNSLGRLFWASVSDKIGRVNTFVAMLSSAAVVFLILPHVDSPVLFSILLAYTLASYGGGFGTIPSLISDLYGPKRMSAVHGKILTGWASAGLIMLFIAAPSFFSCPAHWWLPSNLSTSRPPAFRQSITQRMIRIDGF